MSNGNVRTSVPPAAAASSSSAGEVLFAAKLAAAAVIVSLPVLVGGFAAEDKLVQGLSLGAGK